jgi:hypothetical protein
LFTNASGVYEAAARIPYRLGIAKMAYSDASPTEVVPASLDDAAERMLEAGKVRLEFLKSVRKAAYDEDEPLTFPASADEQQAGREPAAG